MIEPGLEPQTPRGQVGEALNWTERFSKVARFAIDAERALAKAEFEASRDPLTMALNRRGLRKYMKRAEPPRQILLVDATNFKAVNDRFGYTVGDHVVFETFNVLKNSVRSQDVIARIGGDEFVIVLGNESEQSESGKVIGERRTAAEPIQPVVNVKNRIAEEVQRLLEEYKELRTVNFDLAVGSTEWPGLMSVEDLIDEAETEMKIQKALQHQNDNIV